MEREPFDPGDPMDALSEMFRTQVTQLALDAYKITIYRDLNTTEQLQCFLAGVMTGLVGVCLASIDTKGADVMTEAIIAAVPQAREMAESIGVNGKPQVNHHD